MKLIVQKDINLISGFVEDTEEVNLDFFEVYDFNPQNNEKEAIDIVNSQGNSFLAKDIAHVEELLYKQEQLFFVRDGKTGVLSKLELPESFIESLMSQKLKEKIDKDTAQRISKGFDFDGHTFSLSQNAQLNWQGLLLLHQSGIFESQEISTKEGATYLLKKEQLMDFIKAGSSVVTHALKIGRDKKQQL